MGEERKVVEIDVRHPWERQPTDTDESWEAFVAYRDAPKPRRMIRPGVGATSKQQALSHEHGWQARVLAYDRYIDSFRVKAETEAVEMRAREIAEQHLILLSELRAVAIDQAAKLLNTCRKDEMGGIVKPAELVKLTDAIVKLDRLIANQSTENVAVASAGDLSNLSREELLEYERLAEKATKRLPKGED